MERILVADAEDIHKKQEEGIHVLLNRACLRYPDSSTLQESFRNAAMISCGAPELIKSS